MKLKLDVYDSVIYSKKEEFNIKEIWKKAFFFSIFIHTL